MSRGYGKYRRGGSGAGPGHTSSPGFHFDSLFKENSNRPSAARSTATVGKWGITSFTSIRTINGKAETTAPKPKKFFKSRNTETTDLSSAIYDKPDFSYGNPNKKLKSDGGFKPKKFFSSKNKAVVEKVESPETKPPIVLRISRGKSQLVNSSDESESTPTPSSASPRASRKSPTSVRITRSTRRSMQQDPSGSPATGDTATDSFSTSFNSPKKDSDLSPQYIPAEKYELERKAMYDNLLGISNEQNSPNLDSAPDLTIEEKLARMESPEKPDESKPIEDMDLEEASEKLEFDEDSDTNSSNLPENPQKSIPPKSFEDEINMDHMEMKEDDEVMEKKGENPAPVKIVISKKKGSIFKSRMQDGSKKARAVYRHKWSDDKDGNQKNQENESNNSNRSGYEQFGFQDDPLMRISNDGDEGDNGFTSVKCTKNDKGYYTVVRNVKKAYEMQEIGEFQEFNDDVDYILDALQDNNPISTRCLSAITLASKCMAPAFRMHVRAHGTVAKFFRALHDAAKDQSLGLCTATVMFVLSQDRLNMDLDRDCLELMLNLLESDVSYQQALDVVCGLSTSQLEKNKRKVRELCSEIQSQGLAAHLNLDNITVGQLAMETLLSLTSKRAGEWFKEELRELGGIEHIVKTIGECCRQISDYVVTWTDVLLDQLRKVDRCLRVLENVTHNNEENQVYLLRYDDGLILDTLVKLYRLCDAEIPLYPVSDINDKESTGAVIRETLLVTLKVLINLTYHVNKSAEGSSLVGSKQGIIDASLHLLLQIPRYIPDQKKFELGVLVLMLLINLIQDNSANKQTLISAKAPSEGESIFQCDKTAVEALIAQFYQWEECARLEERNTDAILDGKGDNRKHEAKSNEEFIEETVAKLLQKAGTHMEFTFLASYIVMLIGFLIMNDSEYQKEVRTHLRDGNFSIMVDLLKKFFAFMNLTSSTEASSMTAMRATEKVIKFLEECDAEGESTSQPSSKASSADLGYASAH